MTDGAGTLWIVATPIGNRAELSQRAVDILLAADLIAAEDTRRTGTLIRRLAIDTPLISLHEHNEDERVTGLISRLEGGESIAVVSDAGTPGISDPGFVLTRAARLQGFDVRPVAGPCAAIAALATAGLPTDRFVFEGFLPARIGPRQNRLQVLVGEVRTLVFYESGRRLPAMLEDCRSIFGDDRQATISRELTKRFEESIQLALGEIPQWLAEDDDRLRGEFVVCVAGSGVAPDNEVSVELDTLLTELLVLTSTREAARIAARILGVGRNEAYRRALAIGNG